MDGTVAENSPGVPTFEFFAVIGRPAIRFLEHLGKYFEFLWWMIRHLYFLRTYVRDVFRQMFAIGNSSIPIVVFTPGGTGGRPRTGAPLGAARGHGGGGPARVRHVRSCGGDDSP